MPKQTYIPTEADRLTGQNVRRLRRAAGETLAETIERSGLTFSGQSLSRVELGQRQLTVPEATKLAAHFNTTADKIIVKPQMTLHTAIAAFNALRADDEDPIEAAINAPTLNTTVSPAVPTEQEWLGNTGPIPLFPVREQAMTEAQYVKSRTLEVNLDNPLTPDEYREQVWIPYLEQRYAAELKQTG